MHSLRVSRIDQINIYLLTAINGEVIFSKQYCICEIEAFYDHDNKK